RPNGTFSSGREAIRIRAGDSGGRKRPRKTATKNLKYIRIMVDIFARLEKNAGGPIGQYMSYAHGYFAFPKLEGELGPHMIFRGKMMLNWSLNNYLGLANHPEVREADAKGAAEF